MKGVADSSPLHSIVQIKSEDVLRQLFVELITSARFRTGRRQARIAGELGGD
jgi:hypothetical protein